jgi:hypothetical protein
MSDSGPSAFHRNSNKVMRTPKSTAPAAKTPRPRAGARQDGLRPVPIRIPGLDVRRFRTEAHRQSLAAAASANAREDQNFIDAISAHE